ncbi:MAG: hydroxymyristoyl-ACP dehydratase [Spirochaetaceae bacterium]|jgi:3-hydroxymyristoyl/3-hydroxydecanoyl-(acyl carrier protein) dehydratase|nr:hydroxymyristoyl-ACP dehydratase [Spirochaetaceae bacterium]
MEQVYNEKVLKKTDNTLLTELSLSADCDYFNGHFPQVKILPAVAQVDIVLNLASNYLKTPTYVRAAKRLKFTAVIQPEKICHAEIAYNAEKRSLMFTISSPEGTIKYSSGTLLFGTV